MPRFMVEVMERHISYMVVENAVDEADAVRRVKDEGEGEEISLEHYDTDDRREWVVYEVDAENNEIIKEAIE